MVTSFARPAHMVSMSTATIPAPTADDALASLRAILCGDGEAPAPVITMWASACAGGQRIFTSSRLAAAYVVDETRRRIKAGDIAPVTLQRLDGAMEPDWDASSDIADVLAATDWIARCPDPAYKTAWLLRDEVADLIGTILVTED